MKPEDLFYELLNKQDDQRFQQNLAQDLLLMRTEMRLGFPVIEPLNRIIAMPPFLCLWCGEDIRHVENDFCNAKKKLFELKMKDDFEQERISRNFLAIILLEHLAEAKGLNNEQS
jgi:hypothetical protein